MSLPSPAPPPRPVPVSEERAPSRRSAIASAVLVAAVAILLYLPTLRFSYAYDDVTYINHAADVMAGKRSWGEVLLHPQGEHVVPLLRLVLHASTALFGTNALPFRLLTVLSHAGAAFWLALLARRMTGTAAAGLATGLSYVGACGFSSMWIWFPSGASVPFGLFFLTGATAALAWRDRLGVGRARWLAGAGVVLALAAESTLAPLALVPALYDEHERRREGGRRPVGAFSTFCLLAAAATALLAAVVYAHTAAPRFSISIRHGIPRAAFLLLVAPFRYLFPGLQVIASEAGLRTAVLGTLLGLAVAAPAGAALLGLWRRGAPRLAVVAALSAVGPLGFLALVGMGRWRTTYYELYEADRYFFPLLIPLSLLAGAVAASVVRSVRTWPWRTRAALLLIVALGGSAELGLHARAMLGRIPQGVYEAHARRFDQLARLTRRLSDVAEALPPGAPPLRFPDTVIWIPELHNGHVTSRFLLHVVGGASPRLRLGGERVGERDARLLNSVLETWAREIGEPLPYLSVVGGRLVDAHVIPAADFRTGPHPETVVSGFYPWEIGGRWMERRGELRLTMTHPILHFLLAVPMDSLRRADPALEALSVRVGLVDETSGLQISSGEIRITEDGLREYTLSGFGLWNKVGSGRVVHLVLEADRTWTPAGSLQGSRDTRELSVQVFRAGFGAP